MRTLALIGALALGSSGAATAQDDADFDAEPAPSDEIVVFGVRTGSFAPPPSATREEIVTDVYTAEQKSLADVLAERPGIFVRRFGGAGDRSEVTIRGSTPSQVAVSIDGVGVNSALTGGLDLSRVCLPLVDSVEITRGAGSTRQGSGAVGGAVNLVTRGAGAEPDTRASFGAGAFDTYEGSLFHSDSLGAMDYSLGYCGLGTEGDFEFRQPTEVGDGQPAGFEPERATRLNNDRAQHAASLGLGGEVGAGELRLLDHFVWSEGGEPGFDGGNGPTAGQNTEARSEDLSNLAILRWKGRPPAWLGNEFEMSAHHRFERREFEDPITIFTDPIDVTTRLHRTGGQARSHWRAAPLGQVLLSTAQLDFTHDRLSASDQSRRERSSGGAALEETLHLFEQRVVVTAAARLDAAEGFDPELLPSAGLVVAPLSWLRLRAQVGRAYRLPNFDELHHPDEGFIVGNPDLEPEDAWNFDAGAELVFDRLGPVTQLRLGATVFRREIDESIVFLLVSPNTIRPENTGSATAEGVEVSGSFQLTRFLWASAQHTELDSRRDANDRHLPGQPDRETHGRLQLGPEGFWKLVGEVQHTGEILVNEGGSRRLPSRTVWNVSAALNLAEVPGLAYDELFGELWVFGRVDNVGDESVRDSVAFPQPGRHGSAGIEGRW